MHLLRFQCADYRNIEHCDIRFSPGVNLLAGENAQGKTNALECIYTFARGKSFRGTSDENLVRFGQKGFYSEIAFSSCGREQTLSYRYWQGERQRCCNRAVEKKLSSFLGRFRAVLFYPEHLNLVKGGPAERRSFLNVAVSQCYPVYLSLYATYGKLLEQRNRMLCDLQHGLPADREVLEAFSYRLAHTAAQIHGYRSSYVGQLCRFVPDIHRDLSGGREEFSLSYRNEVPADTPDLTAAYEKLFTGDLHREACAGMTLHGVHRDDLELTINGISARSYGSQGQQRSAVLSLKLGEGEVARDITGEYPVFLFDDVFSELDEKRRSYILGDVGERQLIITACRREEMTAHADPHVIVVQDGRFSES